MAKKRESAEHTSTPHPTQETAPNSGAHPPHKAAPNADIDLAIDTSMFNQEELSGFSHRIEKFLAKAKEKQQISQRALFRQNKPQRRSFVMPVTVTILSVVSAALITLLYTSADTSQGIDAEDTIFSPFVSNRPQVVPNSPPNDLIKEVADETGRRALQTVVEIINLGTLQESTESAESVEDTETGESAEPAEIEIIEEAITQRQEELAEIVEELPEDPGALEVDYAGLSKVYEESNLLLTQYEATVSALRAALAATDSPSTRQEIVQQRDSLSAFLQQEQVQNLPFFEGALISGDSLVETVDRYIALLEQQSTTTTVDSIDQEEQGIAAENERAANAAAEELNTKNQELLQENSALAQRIENITERNRVLQSDVTQRTQELNTKNQELLQENSALTQRIENITGRNRVLQSDVTQRTQELSECRRTCEQ